VTAWAIVVPESVAYAQIAGVPPQNAFYAAPVALIAYALFGSSLSPAPAITASAILVVAGIARLGFITNFLAEPALQGFLFGLALIIVVRQAGCRRSTPWCPAPAGELTTIG
jgi:sulfate permease, SulP family